MEKNYIMGFIGGMLLVLAIGIILRIKNRKAKCGEYDERQEAIRGRGFRYAYYTALITLVVGGIAEMLLGRAWCGLFSFAIIALWTSICVFTTYCVVKDAYFTLRSRRRMLITIMLAAGAVNLYFSLDHILSGTMVEGGVLSLNFVNLITAVSCIYIGLMMLAWWMHERRQAVEE